MQNPEQSLREGHFAKKQILGSGFRCVPVVRKDVAKSTTRVQRLQ
jgi:hypothetical protein